MSSGASYSYPQTKEEVRIGPPVAYMTYDQRGRGEQWGICEEAVYNMRLASKERIIATDLSPDKAWVDLSGAQPVVRRRVPLTGDGQMLTAKLNVMTRIGDVPTCVVEIQGPMKMNYEHPGGPLLLGFALPGTYTFKMEAFPYLPATINMKNI